MIHTIRNCYDSHVHFLATGQVAAGLKLNSLKSEIDVRQLQLKPSFYRAEWLTGFGWDQNKWPVKEFPHKKTLDEVFKTTPVFFSRVDGHTSWINSAAIEQFKKVGYNFSSDPIGGKILRDIDGQPSGVLLDQAHINALQLLPKFNDVQNILFIEQAQNIFNRAGFTHVRDLSMNLQTWNLLNKQTLNKRLTVCIDGFVTVENVHDLPSVLTEIKEMQNSPSPLLRIHGIKLFVDGSLGSKTAYLSEPYLNTNDVGLLSWTPNEIAIALKFIWLNKLEAAVHTIGDQAVHEVVQAARTVSAAGTLGRLHLEHVQLIRPETLILMKPLHISCHMQPCHWLSDQSWLPKVLSPRQLTNLFPWENLRKNKILFDFGSDSPIEAPGLLRTPEALQKSAKSGVPELKSNWQVYHQHPDLNWTNSRTEFDDQTIKQVYFNGEPLL
ncbi:MAG: amidohydrolase family protein [Bdellovibrionaceae bacterium]|nr:amidohydrolase family protein [Bdellovibrio sp.]